jgi:hypothetical protein
LTFDDSPEIAQSPFKQALDAGATDAECTISEGESFPPTCAWANSKR